MLSQTHSILNISRGLNAQPKQSKAHCSSQKIITPLKAMLFRNSLLSLVGIIDSDWPQTRLIVSLDDDVAFAQVDPDVRVALYFPMTIALQIYCMCLMVHPSASS
jgi:hypothetical protein